MAVSAKTRVRKTFPQSGKLAFSQAIILQCIARVMPGQMSCPPTPLPVCRQENCLSRSLSGWGANWGSARIMEEMKNDKDAVIASDGG